MYLVQFLLPVYDNNKQPFPRPDFDDVRRELTDKFGGVTAFVRSPAVGHWKEEGDADVSRDDVVMFEVMTEDLDERWWSKYRQKLESKFRQEELSSQCPVVSSQAVRSQYSTFCFGCLTRSLPPGSEFFAPRMGAGQLTLLAKLEEFGTGRGSDRVDHSAQVIADPFESAHLC